MDSFFLPIFALFNPDSGSTVSHTSEVSVVTRPRYCQTSCDSIVAWCCDGYGCNSSLSWASFDLLAWFSSWVSRDRFPALDKEMRSRISCRSFNLVFNDLFSAFCSVAFLFLIFFVRCMEYHLFLISLSVRVLMSFDMEDHLIQKRKPYWVRDTKAWLSYFQSLKLLLWTIRFKHGTNQLFFLGRPVSFFDVRPKMVLPPLSTLLSSTRLIVTRFVDPASDNCPILLASRLLFDSIQ